MASATEASQQANRSAMDPKRLVVIFYLVSGIVVTLFLSHVLGLLWARAGFKDPELIEGLPTLTGILGFLLTVGLVVGAWLHPKTHGLSMEVAGELMKVTWPTWAETRVSTVAVIVASVVAAVILFAIDTLAFKLMVDWLPAVWGQMS